MWYVETSNLSHLQPQVEKYTDIIPTGITNSNTYKTIYPSEPFESKFLVGSQVLYIRFVIQNHFELNKNKS